MEAVETIKYRKGEVSAYYFDVINIMGYYCRVYYTEPIYFWINGYPATIIIIRTDCGLEVKLALQFDGALYGISSNAGGMFERHIKDALKPYHRDLINRTFNQFSDIKRVD